MIGYAIDLSHHQSPDSLPWDQFASHVDAVIVRASYGSGLRDRHCLEHVRRARAIGARVGLYHFYRPHQSVWNQLDLFWSQLEAAGIRSGDIVPALDVEHDPIPAPGAPVSSSWEPDVRRFAEALIARYGDCMVYITQREWGLLGKPSWVLERPLWVAHYTAANAPASPGGVEPVLWQHRVAPFVPNGPGGYDKARPELDQNRILQPLPRIKKKPADSYAIVPTSHEDDDEWDELRERVALQQFTVDELLESRYNPEESST